MTKLPRVGGIEQFAVARPVYWETDPSTLLPCPFCGDEGAYTLPGRTPGFWDGDASKTHPVAVQCSNTSCGVMTPKHYIDRPAAALAWNRRAQTVGDSP